MSVPLAPSNEDSRLAALADYEILYTNPEKSFDSITLLASQICNVPIAMIVFVDRDQQCFKSTHGLPQELKDVKATPRDVAICAYTILSADLLEISDLTRDERFKHNPHVTGFPFLRFYAGVPLTTAEGMNVGSLCVLDYQPKALNEKQRHALSNLSRIVISLMNARRDLAEANLFEQVFQNSSNEIYLFDSHSKCIYTNQWYLKNLSERDVNFLDVDLNRLFPDIATDEMKAMLDSLFAKEKSMIFCETIRKREDGSEYFVDVRLQVNFSKRIPILIVVVNDVTNRKIAEQKVEIALEPNHENSQFLAAVGHEMRTPLTGLISMSSMLYNTSLTPEQKDYVRMIHHSSEHLLTIVNNILDLSRIEAGLIKLEKSDFDLHSLIAEMVEKFAAKAHAKNLTLWADIDSTTPRWVNGDYLRIQQILNNLMSNAIKFTEEGKICLSAKLEKNYPESTVVVFKVKDNGVGLSPNIQKDLFSTGENPKYDGSGFALATTKQLVELMGGEIFVKSQSGIGSEFCFSICFDKCDEPHTGDLFINVNLPHIQGAKILCVEASEINKRNIQLPLVSWQMFCDFAKNSHEAMHKLKEAIFNEHPYKLVLIDERMTQASGLDLVIEIRKNEKLKKMPIVLMTQLGLPVSELTLNALEVTSTLTKPISLSKLREVVFSALIPHVLTDKPFAKTKQTIPPMASILIAENDDISKELLLRILFRLGCNRADIANNGLEAVTMAKAKLYDIILMDCEMPGMNGYEATKMIRSFQKQRGQYTPVVAVTANVFDGDREKCLSCGMSDYVPKPIDVPVLSGIIEKWLKKTDRSA